LYKVTVHCIKLPCRTWLLVWGKSACRLEAWT